MPKNEARNLTPVNDVLTNVKFQRISFPVFSGCEKTQVSDLCNSWPNVCFSVCVNVRFRAMHGTESIQSRFEVDAGGCSRWCYLLVCWLLAGFEVAIQAQVSVNVTDFGAKGDAVQFYVNTVSNSVVVTTTNKLSTGDIGKAIELFRVGKPTYGVNSYGVTTNDWQDIVGVITNVVNATNLYLRVLPHSGVTNTYLPQRTLTGVWATYGTDNTPAFSNAVVAVSGYSDATINISNGTYLLMPVGRPNADGYGYGSICLKRGGLHFLGESQSGTILLSRGAWQNYAGTTYPYRGFLFEIVAPIANDLPIIIDNMTLDGGVQRGYLDVQGIQCNTVDGLGWDEQHSAYLTFDSASKGGTATHEVLTNLSVVHWRGEMIKTIDLNTNRNISIRNCLFGDGNATALNIYGTWDVAGNTFSNLFQIAEYYQLYVGGITNVSYFRNNFTTNIWGNGFAFNGGNWTAPPFIMQSNLFYFTGPGQNGIMTMPAANVQILNNEIHCANYMTVFAIGAPGSQVVNGMLNSNILISGNSVYAPSKLTTIFDLGAGGDSASTGITICSNRVSVPDTIFFLIRGGIAAVNVSFHDNNIECPMVYMQSGAAGAGYAPFVLFQANNVYTAAPTYLASVQTNTISYSGGPKHWLDYVATSNVFVLDDSTPLQMPAGAYMEVDNRSNRWAAQNEWNGGGKGDVVVYTGLAKTNSVTVTNGQLATFYWNRGVWATTKTLSPPSNLRPLN